eukprot:Gb_29505 [translate_table: standard]
MEGNIDHGADTTGLSSRKKRGRPRKSDTVLLPGEITALGVMPSYDGKSKKPRNTDNDGSHSAHGNNSLIGQPVHGVLDGSFDAGYLITVRVGDTDTVFRGVVFGPGLSIPPSKITDIAPKVKTTSREVNTSFPHPPYSPPAATPVALSEIYEPVGITEYTPTESGVTPENGLEDQQNHTSSGIPVQEVQETIVEPIHPLVSNQAESVHEGAPFSTQQE